MSDDADQLSLSFTRPKRPQQRVQQLEAYLKGKGWKYRREISAALGWNERLVRRIAALSDDIVSYPGSP